MFLIFGYVTEIYDTITNASGINFAILDIVWYVEYDNLFNNELMRMDAMDAFKSK